MRRGARLCPVTPPAGRGGRMSRSARPLTMSSPSCSSERAPTCTTGATPDTMSRCNGWSPILPIRVPCAVRSGARPAMPPRLCCCPPPADHRSPVSEGTASRGTPSRPSATVGPTPARSVLPCRPDRQARGASTPTRPTRRSVSRPPDCLETSQRRRSRSRGAGRASTTRLCFRPASRNRHGAALSCGRSDAEPAR